MTRRFQKPDYEATLHTSIELGEALPTNHLARFVVEVISQLDLMENAIKTGIKFTSPPVPLSATQRGGIARPESPSPLRREGFGVR